MSTTRVQLIDKNTTVGTAAAEDTKIVFDGNAQDFHVGIDDSTDLLKIGGGTTLGDAMIAINSDGHVTMPLQSAFLVYPSSVQSSFNQGQSVAIAFGTERIDLNADFASNTFTAPVTGSGTVRVDITVSYLSS